MLKNGLFFFPIPIITLLIRFKDMPKYGNDGIMVAHRLLQGEKRGVFKAYVAIVTDF